MKARHNQLSLASIVTLEIEVLVLHQVTGM